MFISWEFLMIPLECDNLEVVFGVLTLSKRYGWRFHMSWRFGVPKRIRSLGAVSTTSIPSGLAHPVSVVEQLLHFLLLLHNISNHGWMSFDPLQSREAGLYVE